MSDPLARLKRAARSNERASRALREALLDAHHSGRYSLAELGRAVGVSKQAIHKAIRKEQQS